VTRRCESTEDMTPMGPKRTVEADHRRATAERSVEAILDAAERLLARHVQVGVSAVAAESGLSRVTVYAHFPTREQLLEAVVERAVRQASVALQATEPDSGPPLDALERMVVVSWRELQRHQATARAAAEQLTPEVQRRAHRAAQRQLRKLADRGRREGQFRTDLPVDWLVGSCIALMHAAVDEVRAGRMNAATAQAALLASIRDLWVAPTSPG
jgi:TetR/AcrR family transcriptional repressor of mexCD-oprJ operon